MFLAVIDAYVINIFRNSFYIVYISLIYRIKIFIYILCEPRHGEDGNHHQERRENRKIYAFGR